VLALFFRLLPLAFEGVLTHVFRTIVIDRVMLMYFVCAFQELGT